MNYTEKYHLPQWEESDRIMMEDFNSAMASLENGISANAAAAAKAQTSADAAQAAADTLPYVTGSYTGTGGPQEIFLGFRPSFLIIAGTQSLADTSGFGPLYFFIAQTGGNIVADRIEFTDTGFRLLSDRERAYPAVQRKDLLYDYIAFK